MALALTAFPPNFGKSDYAGDSKVNLRSVLTEHDAGLKLLAAGPLIVVQVGKNGAGALTLTGTKVGDVVSGVANLSAPADLKSSFEAVITVAGQIQQSSATNLSAVVCQFIVTRNS